MKRRLWNDLVQWKESSHRKPLVLEGGRQVGKTWLLKEFGKQEFKKLAYVNCDNNPLISNLFYDYDISRIIRSLSAIANVNITPKDTLIVLDEIQEVPQGLTSLKYFCEEAGEYPIAAAGSLLGLQIHEGTGFPVGKVDELKLYPLDFLEFMDALGEEATLKMMMQKDQKKWTELSVLKPKLIDLLRQYYYVGGMPEVVYEYVNTHNLQRIRTIQNEILDGYRMDFSKHIPANQISKVNMVWDSLASQLAKENKKFIYGSLRKGARAKEFENAIQWLVDAGLVYKVQRVNKVEKPLDFYEDKEDFKLFMIDLGLLGARAKTNAKDVLLNDNAFEEYKGAFTEQYVAQQLFSEGITPYYYSKENSTLEIDFLVQLEEMFPIEVKASVNLNAKSLKTLLGNHPDMTGWRFSLSDFKKEERLINVPLYLITPWLEDNKEGV